MKQPTKKLAPEDVMFAALKTLHVAAYSTRNWTLPGSDISAKQICALWEAIHEIPDVLTRWDSQTEREAEIMRYFREYVESWKTPNLTSIYLQFKNMPKSTNESE